MEMSLQNKKHIQKLSKKSKNKRLRKYRKRKKTSFSSSERDSSSQHENQDKISSITMKLFGNEDKNKELKNELWKMIKLIIQIISQIKERKSIKKGLEDIVRTMNK